MVYLSNPHICIHHTDFCTSMTCRKRRARLSKRPLLCYTVTHKVIFKLSIAMIFGCHLETCLTIYQMVLKNLTGNQKYIKTFLFSFRSPSSSSRVSSSSWRMSWPNGIFLEETRARSGLTGWRSSRICSSPERGKSALPSSLSMLRY